MDKRSTLSNLFNLHRHLHNTFYSHTHTSTSFKNYKDHSQLSVTVTLFEEVLLVTGFLARQFRIIPSSSGGFGVKTQS